MMWAVSDRELIGQFLELAFQMIFAWVIGIRHGGSEERIDAVWRQSTKWVTGRFTESASRPHNGRRSTEKCEREA